MFFYYYFMEISSVKAEATTRQYSMWSTSGYIEIIYYGLMHIAPETFNSITIKLTA